MRSLRSTRNCVSQEESDDDQTLSQLTSSSTTNNGFRTRPRRNLEATGHSSGDPIPGPSNAASTSSRLRESSRSVPMPTQISSNMSEPIPSSSQSSATSHSEIVRRNQRSQVQEDHNYGDPGPLPLRHSRRSNVTLSRHQRNADELDTSINTSEFTAASATSSSVVAPTTSGRLRQRLAASAPSSSRTEQPVASSSRPSVLASAYLDESDNSSDTDDDKPLRQRETSTRSSDPLAIRRSRHFPVGLDDAAGPSTSRSSRTLKRPYYNEDSDEDGQGSTKRPQKRAAHQAASATVSIGSQMIRTTRQSYPADTFSDEEQNHNDDRDVSEEDLSDEDEDGEPSISVSSRGRVRKLTAKARGIFRE